MQEEKSKVNRRVFFSYAMADYTDAQKLLNALSKQPNIQVFTTQALSAGENWMPKLQQALSECDLFVVLLSPDSLDSNWVLSEIGAAWGLNKPIIPVMTQPELQDKLPSVLRGISSVNFKDFADSQTAHRILERYEEALA